MKDKFVKWKDKDDIEREGWIDYNEWLTLKGKNKTFNPYILQHPLTPKDCFIKQEIYIVLLVFKKDEQKRT